MLLVQGEAGLSLPGSSCRIDGKMRVLPWVNPTSCFPGCGGGWPSAPGLSCPVGGHSVRDLQEPLPKCRVPVLGTNVLSGKSPVQLQPDMSSPLIRTPLWLCGSDTMLSVCLTLQSHDQSWRKGNRSPKAVPRQGQTPRWNKLCWPWICTKPRAHNAGTRC